MTARFVRSAHELVNRHFQKSTYASFKKKKAIKTENCNLERDLKDLFVWQKEKKRERKTLRVFFTTN